MTAPGPARTFAGAAERFLPAVDGKAQDVLRVRQARLRVGLGGARASGFSELMMSLLL
jgi:hypothetical protein